MLFFQGAGSCTCWISICKWDMPCPFMLGLVSPLYIFDTALINMHVVIHKSDVSCGNVQIIQMLSSTPCKIADRFPLVATHTLTRAGSLELLAAAPLLIWGFTHDILKTLEQYPLYCKITCTVLHKTKRGMEASWLSNLWEETCSSVFQLPCYVSVIFGCPLPSFLAHSTP